jgi:hypothetical protein
MKLKEFKELVKNIPDEYSDCDVIVCDAQKKEVYDPVYCLVAVGGLKPPAVKGPLTIKLTPVVK